MQDYLLASSKTVKGMGPGLGTLHPRPRTHGGPHLGRPLLHLHNPPLAAFKRQKI